MSGLRVAFVTPELASAEDPSGGLGNYVARVARALVEAGHHPEVFTLGRDGPGSALRDGVRVHRVLRADARRGVRALLRVCRSLGLRGLHPPILMLLDAFALARAVARAERSAPFAFVQSADELGAGLFVSRSPRRPHLVRCSAALELWAAAIGEDSPRMRWAGRLARASARRADRVYAPSRFVAEHLRTHHGIDVAVLRPPVFLEVAPRGDALPELPKRYLVHFGQLNGCKGTPVLAEALPLAWRREPDLAMVWAGPDRTRHFDAWSRAWGPHRDRVVWLGELAKPALYALVGHAEAAVLPSRADNLPNTAIESLLLGVPVIGSDGASLDELIEPGVTGDLVPIGDPQALADAMLRAWRGEWPVRRGFECRSEVFDAMRPDRAVAALLALAEAAQGRVDPPADEAADRG